MGPPGHMYSFLILIIDLHIRQSSTKKKHVSLNPEGGMGNQVGLLLDDKECHNPLCEVSFHVTLSNEP